MKRSNHGPGPAGVVCLSVIAGLAHVACDDGARPTGPAPDAVAALAVASGDGQSGQTGKRLSDFLVVRATDAAGRPVGGARIRWSVEAGAGEFPPFGGEKFGWTGPDGLASTVFQPMLAGRTVVVATATGASEQSTRFTVDATLPEWPPLPVGSLVIYVADRAGGDGSESRYILDAPDESGRDFRWQSRGCCHSYEYPGTYSIDGSRLDFQFAANFLYQATGILVGDTLSVTYSPAAGIDGFEDGRYVLSR